MSHIGTPAGSDSIRLSCCPCFCLRTCESVWCCCCPQVIHDYPSIHQVNLICNTTNLGVVAPLGYNGLLILSCTFYAFKVPATRLLAMPSLVVKECTMGCRISIQLAGVDSGIRVWFPQRGQVRGDGGLGIVCL